MIDREKVIDGLEKIVEFFEARGDMAVGDGKMLLLSWMRAAEDAIALLKAQEPVKPKMMYFVDEGLTWETYEVPTCGVCGALLGDALFCPMCGRAVKWE